MTQNKQQQAVHTSRLTAARAAIRPEMKGRVMLSGPPGAGKTFTSLVIATALVGPDGRILEIDTEKESALTYADEFAFDHLRWNPPFDPTALAVTLRDAASSYDAVIIDSFSHFWRKQGGVLDIAGGVATGWKEARPIQENLIETILDIDAHVIVCCRSKMDHLIESNGRGGYTVTKMGLKAQQDDDLEYEVNVALEIGMPHVLSVSKSRTNAVPVGTEYLAGLAGDFAAQYRDWLQGGEPVADRADTDALADALNRIEDPIVRQQAKYGFLNDFGRPEFLLVSRLAEAQTWVADRLMGVAPPADRAEDAEPPDNAGEEDESGDGAKGEQKPPPAAAAPPAAPASEEAPEAPEGEKGTDAPEEAALADLRAAATIEVNGNGPGQTGMSLSDVTNALKDAGLSRNGTNSKVRERLIAHLVSERSKPEPPL